MSDLTTGGGQPAAPAGPALTARLLLMAADLIERKGYTRYPDDAAGLDVLAAFGAVATFTTTYALDAMAAAFAGWLLLTGELPGTLRQDPRDIIVRWERAFPGHDTADIVPHLRSAANVINAWSNQ